MATNLDIDLVNKITSFGLTKNEAMAYVSLLGFGTAQARDVSRVSGLNRSTTYVLLETLAKKGLASMSNSEKKRSYTASPPERLIRSLEDDANQSAERLGRARSILPELKSIYVGNGPKPKVTFYEGVKGIESVYEDTLTANELIRAFASIGNMHETLPHYFPDYYRRRAQRGVFIRSIFPDTPEAIERARYDDVEARESALVPHQLYDFSPEINIYDNKIIFMSLKEKFGLIIESEEMASAMKKVFELAWCEATRLSKKNKRKGGK